MSKQKILMLAVGAVASIVLATPRTSVAADLQLPTKARAVQEASCGPCGCLHVTYEYHRQLESTYGLSFDPRNFDQTEPYFYMGAVRPYPRYWCDYAGQDAPQ
jgi:hypothetical protein